jgi:hypothetical protein
MSLELARHEFREERSIWFVDAFGRHTIELLPLETGRTEISLLIPLVVEIRGHTKGMSLELARHEFREERINLISFRSLR